MRVAMFTRKAIEDLRQWAAAYQIQSVPTLMLFQNSEMLYRQSGAMSRNEPLALIHRQNRLKLRTLYISTNGI